MIQSTVMDWLTNLVWWDGKFLGIQWHLWKVIGWSGNILFFSRFFVQWWATERQGRVVVPALFWWLSLAGSMCLLAYGLYRQDSVFIFAYAFTWIPYIRNLVITRRQKKGRQQCRQCDAEGDAMAHFCSQCGQKYQ